MRECQCAGCQHKRLMRDALWNQEVDEMIALALAAISERHGLDDEQARLHLGLHGPIWPGAIQ